MSARLAPGAIKGEIVRVVAWLVLTLKQLGPRFRVAQQLRCQCDGSTWRVALQNIFDAAPHFSLRGIVVDL